MSVRIEREISRGRCALRGCVHSVAVNGLDGAWCVEVWLHGRGRWPQFLLLASERWHRTLYGARMAARQARADYSPGGRLYEGVTK